MKKDFIVIQYWQFPSGEFCCPSCVSENTASPLMMGAANSTVKHVHSRKGNCISYIIHSVLQQFHKVNICCELGGNKREKKQAFVLLMLELSTNCWFPLHSTAQTAKKSSSMYRQAVHLGQINSEGRIVSSWLPIFISELHKNGEKRLNINGANFVQQHAEVV